MKPRVLVTGASRGIGKATALAFARAGFDVAITARTEVEGQGGANALLGRDGKPLPGSLATTLAELQAAGARAIALPMDLLDTASIDAALARLQSEFGGVDVLVNNAIYQGATSTHCWPNWTKAHSNACGRATCARRCASSRRCCPA